MVEVAVTPYYADDLVTIFHGDFRDVYASEAVVVTDPPYGVTSLSWDQWPKDWMLEESLVDVRSMWCFGTLRVFMDHAAEFAAGGWKLSQDVIWEKHNGSGFMADRFRRVHEQAAHFYRGDWADVAHMPQFTQDATARTVRAKTRPPHTGHIERVPYVSTDGGPRLMRSVIQVRSMHGSAENETQKPVGILSPLISYACDKGGLIFDPFMGSGSTLVAAKALGIQAIGVDIRGDQCAIAARRCAQEVLGLDAA